MEPQTVELILSCTPTSACSEFTVKALKFEILIGEESFIAHVPLSTHGKRLFGNKTEV